LREGKSLPKLGYPEVLSILVYLIESIVLFFPEVPIFISNLPATEKILLLCAMLVLPALPYLFGRRQAIYSVLCKLFQVSEDEKKLLIVVWGDPNREWTIDEISRKTGLETKKANNLLKRLANRGLLVINKNHSEERENG
jgi:hypothetical protein